MKLLSRAAVPPANFVGRNGNDVSTVGNHKGGQVTTAKLKVQPDGCSGMAASDPQKHSQFAHGPEFRLSKGILQTATVEVFG